VNNDYNSNRIYIALFAVSEVLRRESVRRI